MRWDGHLGHHRIRLPEQPHVSLVDRPVAGQTALLSVLLVEGGVSDEGSQDLVMESNLWDVVPTTLTIQKSKHLSVGLQLLDDARVEVGVATAGADGSAEVYVARHSLHKAK